MALIAIVFGWPAVVTSVLLTFTGIAMSRWRLAVGGAAAGSGFLFYLFVTPRFRWIALPVALLHFGAAWAVKRGHRLAALDLAAPFVALAILVAALVLGQPAG